MAVARKTQDMGRKAILVCEDLEGPALNVARILDFFEVPWERAGPAALADAGVLPADQEYCVLATMSLAGSVLMNRGRGADMPPILRRAESVFLFGGDTSVATRTLLQAASQSASAEIIPIQRQEILCSVSARRTDLCGPLSGLRVTVPVREMQLAMPPLSPGPNIDPLISTAEGCVFSAVDFNGTPFYLAPGPAVIDIGRPLEKPYFDVASHFLSAAPVVMYLRHAFAGVMSGPAENGACLIVDDPVLRPRYGFVDFRKIAALSVDHDFTCNVAFIPWNWRRSRSSVVELFRKNAGRLSLSIHGCDHTGLEFGADNAGSIDAMARLAQSRMKEHQRRTGLPFEALMVFPQGAFSAATPAVLKRNGFIAAVNTELSPIDQPSRTEICDAWRTAIVRYGDFAIYTRRYPSHGLHNFAFDALLGKPCLIVSHHADFRNECREIVDFVDRLNSLPLRLKWRTLGGVILRAYQQRCLPGDVRHIRMFGSEIIVENPGSAVQHIVMEKMDSSPEEVQRVTVAGQTVPFSFNDGRLGFDLDLAGHSSALIRVDFTDTHCAAQPARPLKSRIGVVMRRYLSEFRDESQARAPWVYASAEKARSLANRIARAT